MANEFVARNGVIALSNSQVTGSFLVTGNVGIGTASPAVKLDVNGIARITTNIIWGTAVNGTTGQIATDNTNNYFDYLGNLYFRGAAASNTLVTFLSTGNVGIGTTNPDNKLTVWGSNNDLTNSQGNINVYTTETAATDVGGSLGLGGYYNGTSLYIPFANITGKKENSTAGNAAGYLAFLTRNNATGTGERMRITSEGDVLIGQTSSTFSTANRTVLTVNGTSTALVGLVTGGTNRGYFFHDATDAYLYNIANGAMLFGTNNTEKMRITSGGNVGIGTTSPSEAAIGLNKILDIGGATVPGIVLHSTSNTSQMAIGTGGDGLIISAAGSANAASDNIIRFFTAAANSSFAISERMRITSGGNVGIGTTSPAYRFDVQVATNKHWAIAASATGEASFRAGDDGYFNFAVGEIDASLLKLNSQSGGVVTIANNLIVTGSLISSGSTAKSNAVVLAASGGFAKSFAIVNNRNITTADTGSFPAWRCNVPCTASMVLMYQDSGSSVVINATKNGSNLLSSDLTNTSLDTWVSSSTLQNQNFNVGDILGFTLVSLAGSPKEITIQTSFNY